MSAGAHLLLVGSAAACALLTLVALAVQAVIA
jgi:hypothetical protein